MAGAGRGHHRQSPCRLRGLDLLGRPFGRALYRSRSAIERRFGELTAAGLGALPPWVRRRHRVKRWVQAKLLIVARKAAFSRNELTSFAPSAAIAAQNMTSSTFSTG